jgi:alkylation response protein AidB-like acyl-CoA dehydrogenase
MPQAPKTAKLEDVSSQASTGSPTIDDTVVARARALRPLLVENAVECERARRIVDENLNALQDAGLLGVMVPARLGGLGASMATQLQVATELAKGCGSTAWVQTLINVTAWSASLLPPDAQREVFEGLQPARVCGVIAPTGKAVPAPGGYRVTGKWGFASACLHSKWASCGVMIEDGEGQEARHGLACMALSDLQLIDTWHVAGMRGTGSQTLVADNVFVPYRRALGGTVPAGFSFGEPLPGAPSDAWPVVSVLALVLVGPSIGMAEAILEAVRGGLGRSGISYTRYERKTESGALLHDMGKAALHIESARLQAMRCAHEIDAAASGRGMDELARARLRGACGYATETLRQAADLLVSAAGASCFAESSPVQRQWRDLNVATRHAFIATAPSYETYGRAMVGLPSVFPLL